MKQETPLLNEDTNSSFNLNKGDMIVLFGYYMNLLPSRWERAQNYFNFYVTLNVSLIGATIGGFSLFDQYPKNLILIFGPILIFITCIFSKRTMVRQDKHIKELIAMLGKFSFELGLYEKLNFHQPKNGKYLWEDDESFLLPKWVDFRMNSGKSSNDFINQFEKGSRKYGYHLFTTFQIFALFLMASIIIMAILKI